MKSFRGKVIVQRKFGENLEAKTQFQKKMEVDNPKQEQEVPTKIVESQGLKIQVMSGEHNYGAIS